MNALLPWAGVLGAVVFFGSFAVPMKVPAVKAVKLHPIVFSSYVSLGIFLSSLPMLLMPSWNWDHFTCLAFISAFGFSIAIIMCSFVVDTLGLGVGQGLWSGVSAVTAFLEGLVFGDQLGNPILAVTGLTLLIAGIVGLALVGASDDSKDSKAEPLIFLEDCHPGAQIACQRKDNKSTRQVLVGVAAALLVGIFGGSIFVPLRYTDLKGLDQMLFSVSFGVGSLLSVPLLLIGHAVLRSCNCAAPLGKWEPVRAGWAGLASGVLWNAGNVCSILALQPPLGMGVGYPLTQSCILVCGIWGVAYYKEIKGPKKIMMFFAFALVLLCGAAVLGVFGSKK